MVLPDDLVKRIQLAPFEQVLDLWADVIEVFGNEGKAALGRCDRFYLLTNILHRPDAIHPWLYARCREVEADPDGCLDLWAREHYKSTIITFTGIIQEIIRDKEITIGLFSHSMKPAKKFLLMIKTELETNEDLKALYPNIFWADPDREAQAAGRQWNSNRLDVKRDTNPREGTVECSGLVDGQPTGSHFRLRVYDDVVTRESVTSPEMIEKTTSAWELSDNLGARGADGKSRAWHIGTRYHFADTYHHILEKKLLRPRLHPATDNGKVDGRPVFLSPAVLKDKIAIQGSNFPAQMLQNPAAGQNAMFKKEWLKFLDVRPATLNIYIMGDPASSKKKGSDSTAIPVIAVDSNRNKILIDGICHKMSLRERWLAIRELRRKWRSAPGVQGVYVGYEKYGMQSDLEYFQEQMDLDKDVFEIQELNWTKDGTQSKEDRVQRLTPDFEKGKFFLIADTKGKETSNQAKMKQQGQAYRVLLPVKRKDHEGNLYGLNKKFLDEFLFFPFAVHDDLIDACSRLYDMDYQPPVIVDQACCEPEVE